MLAVKSLDGTGADCPCTPASDTAAASAAAPRLASHHHRRCRHTHARYSRILAALSFSLSMFCYYASLIRKTSPPRRLTLPRSLSSFVVLSFSQITVFILHNVILVLCHSQSLAVTLLRISLAACFLVFVLCDLPFSVSHNKVCRSSSPFPRRRPPLPVTLLLHQYFRRPSLSSPLPSTAMSLLRHSAVVPQACVLLITLPASPYGSCTVLVIFFRASIIYLDSPATFALMAASCLM